MHSCDSIFRKITETEEELHAKEVTEATSYVQQESEVTKDATEDQSDSGFTDKLKNTFSFLKKGKLLH